MTVLTTLSCTIDDTGCHAPLFSDILETLVARYTGIYGADTYLGEDTQDGEWLGVLAASINDSNAAVVAAYTAFSPSTAQGTGLSSVVKINGLSREVPSYSTVDVVIVGTVGLTITNGIVADPAGGTQWKLPASVTIPSGGSITVTCQADTLGAVTAPANSITRIVTPSRGWNSVNNPAAAAPGSPVESDSDLRQRQGVSTTIPALTVVEAIRGALLALAGVGRVSYDDNSTGSTDAFGVPAGNLAFVVEGGDTAAIAAAIFFRKTPGVPTYGTTSATVVDAYGVSNTIHFYRPTVVTINVAITVQALTGYNSLIGDSIKSTVADVIQNLPAGSTIYPTRLQLPANLYGGEGSSTYDVTVLQIARGAGALGTTPIVLAFNEIPTCLVANVTLTVV